MECHVLRLQYEGISKNHRTKSNLYYSTHSQGKIYSIWKIKSSHIYDNVLIIWRKTLLEAQHCDWCVNRPLDGSSAAAVVIFQKQM